MDIAPFNAAQLLDAAAVCRTRSPAEAAVYLAAFAMPDRSLEACARTPIGRRDTVLATLRAAMFGRRLDLAATCPRCAAQVDVGLTTDALIADAPMADAAEDGPRVTIDARPFRVRPADSADFAAIAAVEDPAEGRELLARRCLAPLDDGPAPLHLSPDDLDAIGGALAAIDPAADPYVSLRCFECALEWDAPIDIARILAGEIESAASALIDEVHDLASVYHWSETAILDLAPDRRQAYLRRIRG